MSLSARIDLENKIFARAAQLQTGVYAKYGKLTSPAKDGKLCAWLAVYNAFFSAENFRAFCTPQEALQARRAYMAQRNGPPGRSVVLGAQDLNFELLLLEEK